jgi:hypothetical protein
MVALYNHFGAKPIAAGKDGNGQATADRLQQPHQAKKKAARWLPFLVLHRD